VEISLVVDLAFLTSLGALYELVLNAQKLDIKGIIFQLRLDTHIVLNYIFLIQNKKIIILYIF
jgi:hypothetical protein